MNSALFTIFTPTYNRAHTLPRLYESLLNQDFTDFEWLIVDDGSSDGTRDLIEKFQNENKIRIKYLFQENAGKHIAVNTGLEYAKGEWFFTLDSDDYLRKNTLRKISEIAQELPKDFAGFTGIHFSDKIIFDEKDFGKKTWTEDNSYDWPHQGEMSFCFKTEIARKYPFPVFEGEKFCQESLVLRRILKDHKVLFTDHVLVGGEYLEDGLSQNIWQRMKESPRYSLLNFAERISQKTAKTKKQELDFAKNYWDIALSAKHIPWVEKLKGIPLGLTAKVFQEKLLKRWRRR